MFAEQVRRALLLAWSIVNAAIVPILAAPFVLPPRIVFSLAPQCEWKARYGRECVFCGMTTSFVPFSEGRLKHTAGCRPGSGRPRPWNECMAFWYAWGERRPRLHRTEEFSCRS